MKPILEFNRPLKGIAVIDDPFWNPKLETFFEVTLKDTFDKLEADGAVENYQNLTEHNATPHKGQPWHDGLLLETIRGAADYLTRKRDPALEARIDGYAQIIERAQLSSGGGYLSTYTQLDRPNQRYGENGGSILWQHDLYNNGALFEAGVHYYLATGKIALLECALRAANELSDTIGVPPKKWIVPGHSLPEYALIELYQLVAGDLSIQDKVATPVRAEEYLHLADFWVHGRGHHEERTNHPRYMGEYAQDHVPIEQQFQAVGHAVRATLYYTGATRLAALTGDEKLLASCLRLWNNVETCKLHINGGIGASHFEEKFGEDYDLINTAYLETCATVGLILWAESLSRATGDARFFQTIERALYNLMLSSVTLQGDSYFYRNPLCSKGDDHHWTWHSCPCCPPMIHKTFGMLHRMVYAQDDEGVIVNLLIGGRFEATLPDGLISASVRSELPWRGEYQIKIECAPAPFKLRIRVPEWARTPAFQLNGASVTPTVARGYAMFTVNAGDEVIFTDDLPVVRMEAHPYVRCDRGRVAITRGPLVYCVEGVDNNGNVDFALAENPGFKTAFQPDLLGGIAIIDGTTSAGKPFRAVPLYAWDNRMASGMSVWLRQAGKRDGWSTEGWENRLYRPYRTDK